MSVVVSQERLSINGLVSHAYTGRGIDSHRDSMSDRESQLQRIIWQHSLQIVIKHLDGSKSSLEDVIKAIEHFTEPSSEASNCLILYENVRSGHVE
jgi:hypothetical protein